MIALSADETSRSLTVELPPPREEPAPVAKRRRGGTYSMVPKRQSTEIPIMKLTAQVTKTEGGVQVVIGGVGHTLDPAEARQLADALHRALGPKP